MVPASEMILGHAAPAFPRWVVSRPFPTRHLAALVQRSVPVLRYLEKTIHPRWHIALHTVGRVVGVAVVLLSAVLILIPIPLSNVAPALVIAFISLAWIEEDRLFLTISLIAAALVVAAMVWATVLGAAWIGQIF